MGHKVQSCGDYEYCLGCGRNTKAKRSKSANNIFWRSEYWKPVTRMKRYRTRNHDIILDDWWACRNCKAKGPLLNKRNCTHFNEQKIDEDPDDSERKHKRRIPYNEEENADKKHEEDNEDPDD
eukprot:9009652-Heterocapsa_arctica.AAC.1